MIVLLGDSCSGKSTIEKQLGLNKIVSYTTRSIRKNETDHVDYHFISKDNYIDLLNNGFFAEYTCYNGWYYAIAKEDCLDNSIAVVEPVGFRQLKKLSYLNITSFYLKVEERERVTRMMKRGDNVMESFRRVISDQGLFSGVENEVDYVIGNPDGQLAIAILNIREILRQRHII